jgi:protein-arginine kinase activator protein McsA
MQDTHNTAADRAEFYSAAVLACENCGATEGFIDWIYTDDGRKPHLCEDCIEEQRRIERMADEMSSVPSACQTRQQIIDESETVQELVNRSRGHDLIGCAECGATRKPAGSAISPEGKAA